MLEMFEGSFCTLEMCKLVGHSVYWKSLHGDTLLSDHRQWCV